MIPVNIAILGAIPLVGGGLIYMLFGFNDAFRYISLFGGGMVLGALCADE